MKIRQKILIYFSVLSIGLIGLSFITIYTLFSNYRTDEFRQRIKDKTYTTLKFLAEVQSIDHDLLQTMDRYTINNLYKEKLLIYNNNKELIYVNLDDTKIEFPIGLLNALNKENSSIEYQENEFDVVAVVFEFQNQNYYGIAKAYDIYGLSKLTFLKYSLLIIFACIAFIISLSSFFISKQITHPINRISAELNQLQFDSKDSLITIPNSGDEIAFLATRFNDLMKRLNDSYLFQKHATHHISHELKTPIAKLVSNFEKLENESNIDTLKSALRIHKIDTKNLGDIVNTLLEISKIESGNTIDMEEIRIDETIFDIIDEISIINEEYRFNVEIDQSLESEQSLIVIGNKKLIRIALTNVMMNCIQYSNSLNAEIKISNNSNTLQIQFLNTGSIINKDEELFIFERFYRGKNSHGKRGFGLGLVLCNKIIQLHNGSISYNSKGNNTNIFSIDFPLRSILFPLS